MKTVIHLDKIVTVMKDLAIGKCATYTLKYKELEKELLKLNEIEVNYCFGERKRRMNQLSKLGFTIKQTIFFNDDAPHSRIKEVWAR